MTEKPGPRNDVEADRKLILETLPPEKQLQHFRNVTVSLVNGALNVWAELWKELEDRLASSSAVPPEASREFKPGCGWPEFLEKMCLLRYYLGAVRKLTEQGEETGDSVL